MGNSTDAMVCITLDPGRTYYRRYKMKVTVRWLGHAFVELRTEDGKVILFDPWTKDDGNPACPIGIDEITQADLILVSHDHHDHIGSVPAIASRTGALVGGPVQTIRRLIEEGLIPEDRGVNFGFGYMVGGGTDLDWVKVVATPAFHSSDSACALGNIAILKGGPTVYHAGDTAIFSEMEIYGRLYPIDLALLPIGGTFTMDARQAAEAVRMLKPGKVMPIHYASFPIVAKTADEFTSYCKKQSPEVEVLSPPVGESVTI